MCWTRKARKKNLPNDVMENKEVETIIQESVDGVKVRDFALVWEDIKHDVQPIKKGKKNLPKSSVGKIKEEKSSIWKIMEDKGR